MAESPYATGPILDIASRDKDKLVRLAAVSNNNIGVKSLLRLCNDSDSEIAMLANQKLQGKKI